MQKAAISEISKCIINIIITPSHIYVHVGADISGAKLEDAGHILSDILRQYMSDMGVVDGLQAMGYGTEDIPDLVRGTLPQVKYVHRSCMHIIRSV